MWTEFKVLKLALLLARPMPPSFRWTSQRGRRKKKKKNTAPAPAPVRVPLAPAGGRNAVKDGRRTPAARAKRQQKYNDRVAAWRAEPDPLDRAAVAADSTSKARSASRAQLPQTAKASWPPPLPPPPGPPPPVFGLPLGPPPPPGPRPPSGPPSASLLAQYSGPEQPPGDFSQGGGFYPYEWARPNPCFYPAVPKPPAAPPPPKGSVARVPVPGSRPIPRGPPVSLAKRTRTPSRSGSPLSNRSVSPCTARASSVPAVSGSVEPAPLVVPLIEFRGEELSLNEAEEAVTDAYAEAIRLEAREFHRGRSTTRERRKSDRSRSRPRERKLAALATFGKEIAQGVVDIATARLIRDHGVVPLSATQGTFSVIPPVSVPDNLTPTKEESPPAVDPPKEEAPALGRSKGRGTALAPAVVPASEPPSGSGGHNPKSPSQSPEPLRAQLTPRPSGRKFVVGKGKGAFSSNSELVFVNSDEKSKSCKEESPKEHTAPKVESKMED